MAEKLHFALVSPEGEVLSEAVDAVRVPASEGEFGALSRISPLVALIADAKTKGAAIVLEVVNDNQTRRYDIEGGFVDVTPDGVSVLAQRITPL